MIPKGQRGNTIYKLAYALGQSSKAIGPGCQEIALQGLAAGLTTAEVYRHIGRGIAKARLHRTASVGKKGALIEHHARL